ncbi:MAG TPA: rhodanese-like domain-containing protein [Bacteroidales bacterium]|nr:rhodanese-like domain-containing protein [Bacteroidales bacterium]HCI56079.1 rhodanese-like domain-containing protein [Bacteroidales bacterium]HOU95991.1 rhodanese-like domain-containing protein [Bacteroidales bacterium]HQG36546.1 rhodanese-like domain-containing protein [Bacteroidales bacterium]HQG53036.1 rhodanese-like domain-containing protein [Bacteroidales bacterium]
MKQGFLILIFFLTIFYNIDAQLPDSIKYRSVDPEDFLTLLRLRENVLVIDVSLPREFRRERIEGAINIPLAKIEKRCRKYLSDSRVILLYCTNGFRSEQAAIKLYDMGFREIYCLRGGLWAWKKRGITTVK